MRDSVTLWHVARMEGSHGGQDGRLRRSSMDIFCNPARTGVSPQKSLSLLQAVREAMCAVVQIDASISYARGLRDGPSLGLFFYLLARHFDEWREGPARRRGGGAAPSTDGLPDAADAATKVATEVAAEGSDAPSALPPVLSIAFLWNWRGSATLCLQRDIGRLRRGRAARLRALGNFISDPAYVPEELPPLALVRPSWVVQRLLPAAGYGLVAAAAGRLALSLDWRHCQALLTEAALAGSNLLRDWIVAPLVDIWQTIRYRSSTPSLVTATALAADVEVGGGPLRLQPDLFASYARTHF